MWWDTWQESTIGADVRWQGWWWFTPSERKIKETSSCCKGMHFSAQRAPHATFFSTSYALAVYCPFAECQCNWTVWNMPPLLQQDKSALASRDLCWKWEEAVCQVWQCCKEQTMFEKSQENCKIICLMQQWNRTYNRIPYCSLCFSLQCKGLKKTHEVNADNSQGEGDKPMTKSNVTKVRKQNRKHSTCRNTCWALVACLSFAEYKCNWTVWNMSPFLQWGKPACAPTKLCWVWAEAVLQVWCYKEQPHIERTQEMGQCFWQNMNISEQDIGMKITILQCKGQKKTEEETDVHSQQEKNKTKKQSSAIKVRKEKLKC